MLWNFLVSTAIFASGCFAGWYANELVKSEVVAIISKLKSRFSK